MPVRPSPTESATLFAAGERKRGNDGRMYAVALTKAGVKRWAAVPKGAIGAKGAKVKTVFVVDNGSMPFMVRLDGGTAQVFKLPEGVEYEDEDEDGEPKRGAALQRLYTVPVATLAYERAFVGLCPSEKKGAPKASWPERLLLGVGKRREWWHGGNSVLLHLGSTAAGHTYAFIGEEIFRFRTPTDDPVVGYVSYMGNSAVPYPWATGARNTYLMGEHLHMPNALLECGDRLTPPERDPYQVFYGINLATCEKKDKKDRLANRRAADAWRRAHPLAGFKVIHERI